MTLTTFNEWRHRHSDYDKSLCSAQDEEAVRAIMERIALQAMQLAHSRGDRRFAQQVMDWAHSKRLLTDEE